MRVTRQAQREAQSLTHAWYAAAGSDGHRAMQACNEPPGQPGGEGVGAAGVGAGAGVGTAGEQTVPTAAPSLAKP